MTEGDRVELLHTTVRRKETLDRKKALESERFCEPLAFQ
jgi:hypothetical protein